MNHKRSNPLLSLSLSAVLLSGCALPERTPPQLEIPVPDQFEAGSSAPGEIGSKWWEGFGDPELDAHIERALSDSPAILQAIARTEQARALADLAGADQSPQVSLGFGAGRQKLTLESLGIVVPSDAGGAGTQTSYRINTFDLTGNVSWELDLWGRLSAQSAAAQADFLASEANLQSVRQSIAAQTARAYFAMIEASQQVAFARQVVDNAVEMERQISNRVRLGAAQPADGQLAIASLASANAKLAAREEILARAKRQFDVLLGDYPDGVVALADQLPALQSQPPAGLPAELLSRRPDILAAHLNLQAAGFRLDAAERSFLPSIELTGRAGTSSTQLSNLLDPDFFIWSIAGRLLQPIFQGGRLRAQFDLREGERNEALQLYADTVLNALGEVETALAVEEFLAEQEQELATAFAAASEAHRIARNRYDVGSDPLLNVLDAQNRMIEAQSALLVVRQARIDNRINLHLVLGGGF